MPARKLVCATYQYIRSNRILSYVRDDQNQVEVPSSEDLLENFKQLRNKEGHSVRHFNHHAVIVHTPVRWVISIGNQPYRLNQANRSSFKRKRASSSIFDTLVAT